MKSLEILARVLTLLTIAALSGCGPSNDSPIPAYEFKQYNLFTWKAASGDYCFALMIQAESHGFLRSLTAKRNGKCGISELKKALNTLPKSSVVLWQDWPPKFDYPPEVVIEEIIAFAKINDVRLEQSPAVRQVSRTTDQAERPESPLLPRF